MKKIAKRIAALSLAAVCTVCTAGMTMASYSAVDEFGKWKHSDRDKPLDWYHSWIEHQMELDQRGYLYYKDETGKTWLDWWEINH